jgi:hypothetical protein
MKISRKFKKLTKLTYPHGTEFALVNHLPQGYQVDGVGNYYLKIGDTPSTMFTCHLDTACYKQVKVNHVEEGNFIRTDGTSILGADDKAGMVVLLYMIENKIPGLYYFFIGEESGCIGSGRLASIWNTTEFSKYITKVVSFDRRGTCSVITEQLYGVSCSGDFALELSSRLNSTELGFNFSPDPTGIYTDSAKFMSLVPECTNISVGYYNEHTNSEKQDIDFLRRLCKGVCMIDWETLPISRNPKSSYGSSYWDDDYDFDNDIEEEEIDENYWSADKFSTFFDEDGNFKRMYISSERIEQEVDMIESWLSMTQSFYSSDDIEWNGDSLYIGTEYIGRRDELSKLIPDLSMISMNDLMSEEEFKS